MSINGFSRGIAAFYPEGDNTRRGVDLRMDFCFDVKNKSMDELVFRLIGQQRKLAADVIKCILETEWVSKKDHCMSKHPVVVVIRED